MLKANSQDCSKNTAYRPGGNREASELPYLSGYSNSSKTTEWDTLNQTERKNILASGDQDKILKYYTQLYYSSVANSPCLDNDSIQGRDIME